MLFSRKDLVRLILPLMVEQLLAITIGLADTVMVSTCGEAAISGISQVDSINVLLINIFSALATGGAIISAQYLGRNEDDNASVAAKQLIYTTGFCAVVVAILCIIGNRFILSLLFGQVEPEVMSNSEIYFFWSALSYPFLALYNCGAALFRSMGNSKISMFASLIMNIINISGNALLIYGAGLGVAGAAIASLASRIFGAIVMLRLLHHQENRIYIHDMRHPHLNPQMIRNILGLGIPNGMENGMFQIGKILVQGLIASFGTVSIAANAVANSVSTIPQISGGAIGLAMITVVGQCVGAGDYKQAKQYILKLVGLTYISMGLLHVFILITAPFIVSVFGNLQAETADLAVLLIRSCSLFAIPFWPASFTLPNGLRAASDVKFTMTVSIFSMWVFRICFSFLLARYMGLGVLGVWLAMYIDWIFRLICFIIRFVRGKWQHQQVAAA